MSITWSEQDTRSFLTARGETDDDDDEEEEEEYNNHREDDYIGNSSTMKNEHNYRYFCEHDNNHDNGHVKQHGNIMYDEEEDSTALAKVQSAMHFKQEEDGSLTKRTERLVQQQQQQQEDSRNSMTTPTPTTAATAMIVSAANSAPPAKQGDTCNSMTTPPISTPPSIPLPQSLSSPLWFGSSRCSSSSMSPPCPPIPTSILRRDVIFPTHHGSTGATTNTHDYYSILNDPTGMSTSNHNHHNNHSHSMDQHLMMSPMASLSLAEDSTRTLPQRAIDLNLRIDQPPNTAWVYIHPRANTPSVRDLVHDLLLDHINPLYDGGGRIVAEYDLNGQMLAEYHEVIDRQYGLISKYAMMNQVDIIGMTTVVCEKEFQKGFGEDWSMVWREKRLYSGREAMEVLRCDARGLYEAWKEAEVVRLGKDLYCGRIHQCSVGGKWVYVLNGFFMAMRNEYLEPSSCVHAYVIQWSAEMLPWKDFLTRAIGSSDPCKALPDSLRRTIYERYRNLEMEEQPNELFNAIHASESPLEGLAERLNWSFTKTVQHDEFGRILLGKGIPESKILEWCENSKVSMSWEITPIGRGVDVSGMMDIFDVVKGMDTRECLDTLIQVYDCELFGSKEGRENKRKRRRRRRIIHRASSVDNEAKGGCCIIS